MPSSIYVQLANFFFVMAAIFNDVLLIRISLTVANAFLILTAALGWPMWPEFAAPGNPAPVDTLVWCSIAFVLHFWATSVLIMDERSRGRFEDDHVESLYQFFLNRTGVARRDFVRILNNGRWTRIVHKGTRIDTDKELYLIVEGYVDCEIDGWRRREDDRQFTERERKSKGSSFRIRLGSGEIFDLRLANVFDVPVGFFNTSFGARTASDNVLLFSWSLDALEEFSHRSPPVIVQTWRNLIAFAVADIAHRPLMSEEERMKHMIKDSKHADFRIPVTQPPSKKKRAVDTMKWLLKSMDPRPPPGLRHTAIPVLSINATASLYKDSRLSSMQIETA